MGEMMIERVARAAENAILNPMAHCCSVSIVGDPARFYNVIARAVLTAMREPTEAMIQAGAEKLPSVVDTMGEADEAASDAWRAMIDAALEEG